MKTKKQYTAPELTVVTFKAEQGYAQSQRSLTSFQINTLLGLSKPVVSSQETWAIDENTFGGGWN